MESITSTNIGNRYQRIINVLLLNTSFIDNLGLMHGKMGIAIYFFLMARETKNQIYEEYAGELIDEIYDEISDKTPLDFENGLAGIGWGIEYLVQNDFIGANTDEVLAEFDHRLIQGLISNTPDDPCLLNGLIGIGAYFLKRLQNPSVLCDKIPTLINKQLLLYVVNELELRSAENSNFIKEPDQFEITWSYPLLLCFLAELIDLDLFNLKISLLIQRLITLMHNQINLPKLCSSKLFLLLAIEKIKKYDLEKWIEQEEERILWNSNLVLLSNQLFQQINRHEFEKESLNHNFTIKNGTNGISLLYYILYITVGEKYFIDEANYWAGKTISMQKKEDSTLAGFTMDSDLGEFGLLTGLAGIVLRHYHEIANLTHN